jgi:hypothetical protein
MNIQEILSRLNQVMTDEQIGAEIDAPQGTVCRLRNGKHKNPSYERGLKIRSLAIRKGILRSDIFSEPEQAPNTSAIGPDAPPANSLPAQPDNAGRKAGSA